MKIKTDRFGEIEIHEQELLHLPGGVIGFSDCKRVVLLEHHTDSPFRWLQSVDQPELAFVVIDPTLFVEDYPVDKLKKMLSTVDKKVEEVAVATIATVPPAPRPITVNLLAPLVFDIKARKGAQIILNDPRYKTRHILAAEAESEQDASKAHAEEPKPGKHPDSSSEPADTK